MKLTLSIPEDSLKAAKIYSKQCGKSLSSLVAQYFDLLSRQHSETEEIDSIHPRVRKLTGIVAYGTRFRGNAKKEDQDLLWDALKKKYL